MMKILFSITVSLLLFLSTFHSVNGGFFDSFIDSGKPNIYICNDEGECGLLIGIKKMKDALYGIETERSFSVYVQDIIQYLLTFISIIAVIYIIYAGFMILIGNGDEEKVKKSKSTIIYVVVGIILIWLAWPITKLILNILGS